jgi:hypothetical protein
VNSLLIVDPLVFVVYFSCVSLFSCEREDEMSTGSGGKRIPGEEVTNVVLTDEQRSLIEKATGVTLAECSLLKLSTKSTHEVKAAFLSGGSSYAFVCCW